MGNRPLRYLVYDTEASAVADELRMRNAYFSKMAAKGYQVTDGKLYGRRNGVLALDAQPTERWTDVEQRPSDNKYLVTHPEAHPEAQRESEFAQDIMVGVTGRDDNEVYVNFQEAETA